MNEIKIDSSIYNELRKIKSNREFLNSVKVHIEGKGSDWFNEFSKYVLKIAYDRLDAKSLDYLLKIEGGFKPDLLGIIHTQVMISEKVNATIGAKDNSIMSKKDNSEINQKILDILCEHIPSSVFLNTVKNYAEDGGIKNEIKNAKNEMNYIILDNFIKSKDNPIKVKIKKI